MSAEEMFKKLGFYEEQSCVLSSKIWCIDDCKIIFDAIDREILLETADCIPLSVLDAINKQVEELGWREEK